MSAIFGLAQLNVSDYQFVRQVNQSILYDATVAYLNLVNEDVSRATSVFVSGVIEKISERYQLPGTGRMSQRAEGTRGAAVRATGNWSVGYPIYDFAEQVAGTREDFAYMSPQEYQKHVDTIVNRYRTEIRWQILHALFDSVGWTFKDKREGDIAVVPLANGDSVTYPPVLGTTTEATDTHYLESGYAASSISDTNDPYVTMIDELEEHFGETTGGSNIVVFINNAQRAKTEDLTDFTPVPDNFLSVGSNTDVPERLPMVPGKLLGRHDGGAWISQWRWIPANYMLAVHLEAEAPCKMRVHPAGTGLPRGLQLVAEDDSYPVESAEWNVLFGIAVANRLNGVAMELGTGGSYTIPTDYD